MANNRLFVVDTETGDYKCLLKTMGDGWYFPIPFRDSKGDIMVDWLDRRDIGQSYGNCGLDDLPSKLVLMTENELYEKGYRKGRQG